MKISKVGLDLIKKYEGCRLKAYKCPAGVWTIGYGTTGTVDGEPIRSGMTITKEKAEELLAKDMEKFEKHVEEYDKTYHWTQNEFDAMVSFAYNVGSIKQLTDNRLRSKEVIAQKMLLYNKGGGRELAGLTRRRKEERALFLKDSDSDSNSSDVYYKASCNLNCRDYPSNGGVILGVFKSGTKVKYISKNNGWYKVQGKATNGKTIKGYCYSKYLKKVEKK